MFHKLIKGIAPVAAIALSAALAGCGDVKYDINGDEGVPLAELDMSGDAPTELVLAGPDTVVISEGAKLDIDVAGDAAAVDLIRFTLEDGTLGVLRKNGAGKTSSTAVIRVTMPAPKALTIAGSGTIEAPTMGDVADINILGTGSLIVKALKSSKADVNVAGSGSFTTSGSADTLDLNVLGSGSAAMRELQVQNADITIAGSGEAEFASDGKIDANIMGSGKVTVHGRATCTVSAMGSGKVVCHNVDDAGTASATASAQ